MLKAEQEGVAPEALIDRIGEEHRADFRDFGISFDSYHTTHSPENRACSELIYTRLKEAGHIARKDVAQAYDPVKEMFLPDRYVKGTCPSCGAPDQYGDNCEVCGATYSPADSRRPGIGPVGGEARAPFVGAPLRAPGGFRDDVAPVARRRRS